jgi:Tfp pilus assembly protein PilN
MVNILPHKSQNELRAMYYSRLFGTFFLSTGVVIIIGAAVLIPSYFLAQEEADASRRYADALQQTLTLGEGSSSGKMLPVLAEQVGLMKAYQADPAIAPALKRIIGVLPDEVSIRRISFTFLSITDGRVTLNGNAETRAALLAFVDVLKKDAQFKGVTVPVADLVADTDLPFTLSFSVVATKP